MKHLIFAFSFLVFSCNSQEKSIFKKSLTIEFTSGDESYKTQQMNFVVKDGDIVGTITEPNTNELLSSETHLSEKSIILLNSFIRLANEHRNGCDEGQVSTWVQRYRISIDGDQFRISKFCDWKSLSYVDLEKQIFGSYLKSLKNKKKAFNQSFSKTLIGKWKESESLENMNIRTPWNLTKFNFTKIGEDYFEVLKNQKAILHRKNKKIYYNFRIDVLNGKKYFVLLGDDEKNKGLDFIYGHNFEIVEVSENKIMMIH